MGNSSASATVGLGAGPYAPVPAPVAEANAVAVSLDGLVPVVSTTVVSSAPGIKSKTLSARQISETTFWVVQLKEHCLFLYLGLEPSPAIIESKLLSGLAAPSLTTSAPISLQTPMVENAKLVNKLKLRAQQLFMSWSEYEAMVKGGVIDVAILNNLVNHTRYLKSRVLDLQRQNIWVGWLFPEFVDHMRDELDYFVNRFNDTIDPDTERLFWDEINGEHLAFTAHLLNTDYKQSRPLVDQALKLSDEALSALANLKKAPIDLQQMAELSKRFDHLAYANRTDAFFSLAWANGSSGNAAGASIHPVLVAHVIREGQRSIQRLTELGTPAAKLAGHAKTYAQLSNAIQKK